MSKQITIAPSLVMPSDFEGLETFMARLGKAEIGFECGLSFVRMLQGACLEELHKQFPETRGGDQTSSKNRKNSAFASWADYVRQRWGFSEDTARLRREMWRAGKPAMRKMAENMRAGLSAVFDRPITTLSDQEFATLKAVTHKLTDGKSVRMIQEELGLFKGDAKKTKGGKRVKGTSDDDGELPSEAPAGWVQALWDRYRVLSPEQREAFDFIYLPVLRLSADFERHWANLPDDERADIDGHLLDMRNRIKSAQKTAGK